MPLEEGMQHGPIGHASCLVMGIKRATESFYLKPPVARLII